MREIGRGGFGVVWLAEDTRLDNRHVAIKLLEARVLRDAASVASLRREATIALNLTHPRIVRLYIFDTDGSLSYLVFEFLAGPTLSTIRAARGHLSLPEVVLIAEQVCEALDYAHGKGVIHCDIKPSNIMLEHDMPDPGRTPLTPNNCQLKVTDLGIAKLFSDAMSGGGPLIGTPTHMSPEQLRGMPPTAASDIYSLGCVLYQLLAGHPPFHTGDVVRRQINDPPPPLGGIPEPVEEVILRCLAKAPEARWPSAKALAQALKVGLNLTPAPWMEDAPPSLRTREHFKAESEPAAAPGEYIGPLNMLFRLVPGGAYQMGSPPAEEGRRDYEGPVHRVVLNPFYIGKFPVTVQEYGEYLTRSRRPKPHRWAEQRRHPRRPVVYISWDEAETFCEWLTQVGGQQFRLPTEAEWERAARGGLDGCLYPWGDEAPEGRAVFNPGESRDSTKWEVIDTYLREVGIFPANEFQLHDMAGLVAEWCLDCFSPVYYAESAERNPPGPPHGAHRVLRGGSWLLPAQMVRCAARHFLGAGSRCPDYGLRVVCEVPR